MPFLRILPPNSVKALKAIQNSSDKSLCYPPDDHHSSGDVYWRGGRYKQRERERERESGTYGGQ